MVGSWGGQPPIAGHCSAIYALPFLSTNGLPPRFVQKAKEVRPLAERLITLGKRETLHARRQAAGFLLKAAVVQKLFDTIASRYADRNGGYTRIIKLGYRSGDGAELAVLELLGSELSVKKAERAAAEKAKKEKSKKEGSDTGSEAEASAETEGSSSVTKKLSKRIKGALRKKPKEKAPQHSSAEEPTKES
jgi:large subunit ribosomal protein L17